MPCTAKEFEAMRPEMNASGFRDVDFVLTTREIARIFREGGIDFTEIPESLPDPLLSNYTGAATIFQREWRCHERQPTASQHPRQAKNPPGKLIRGRQKSSPPKISRES